MINYGYIIINSSKIVPTYIIRKALSAHDR